jgi:hypothetical protein
MFHVVDPSSYAPHGAPFHAIMPAVFRMSLFEAVLLPILSLHACLLSHASTQVFQRLGLGSEDMKCAMVHPTTHDLYWKAGVVELALVPVIPMRSVTPVIPFSLSHRSVATYEEAERAVRELRGAPQGRAETARHLLAVVLLARVAAVRVGASLNLGGVDLLGARRLPKLVSALHVPVGRTPPVEGRAARRVMSYQAGTERQGRRRMFRVVGGATHHRP